MAGRQDPAHRGRRARLTPETSRKLWAGALLLAALAFAASPFFAPGFDGFEPSQFPEPQRDPPVQPAGYAFAIWGLIYVWLIAGACFGFLKRADDPDWAEMRKPMVMSLAVGALWLPAAQQSVALATIMIWVMLATALIALMRTGDTDRWWQMSPVAVYAGWLTAAACVSIGLVLAGYELLPETPAALVALTLALVISVTVQYRLHRAPEYGITVIWALVAVIVANARPFNAAVVGLAVIGIAAILAIRGTDTE